MFAVIHMPLVTLRLLAATVLMAVLAGCGAAPVDRSNTTSEVWVLSQALRSLSPQVDASEAARAAALAISYPLELREQYDVTDPPLIHNTKVNLGQKERGLCWHWADDLEKRLAAEGFTTLTLHRAIANANSLLIDHSTVVISARGDTMEEGIVLDGWRHGGNLFWSPVREDPRYDWERRAEVFARRR